MFCDLSGSLRVNEALSANSSHLGVSQAQSQHSSGFHHNIIAYFHYHYFTDEELEAQRGQKWLP